MGTVRFNHMELTLPRGELSETRREDLRTFYHDVFGWDAIDVPILGQNGLLLKVDDEVSQFILVVESDKPISSPGYDHLGMLLESREEVDALLARAKAYRDRDPRVEIKEYDDLDQGGVTVHAIYVRFGLPLYFDVQSMDWAEGSRPAKEWRYS